MKGGSGLLGITPFGHRSVTERSSFVLIVWFFFFKIFAHTRAIVKLARNYCFEMNFSNLVDD